MIETLRADILLEPDPIAKFRYLRALAELELATRSMQLARAHHQAKPPTPET